jgi:hypothetical protein
VDDPQDAPGPRPVRVVRLRAALAGAVVIAVVSGAVVAWAGPAGPFPDVPADHPFAEEIQNLADAGITGGFADGGFHPGEAVTRQSMAAFLGRGLGRVGSVSFDASAATEIVTDGAFISLPEARLFPGANGNAQGTGFAIVTATVEVARNADTCACRFTAFLQASKDDFANVEFVGDSYALDMAAGSSIGTITVTAVVELDAGTEWQFRIAAANNVDGFSISGTNSRFSGTMSVLYVPFGFDGTQALGP